MFCIHCGKKVEDNSNFCTNCGESQLSSESKLIENKTRTKEKSSSIFPQIVGAIVFVFVFLVTKYIVQNGVLGFLSSNDLEKTLSEASSEMNKDMPMTIDNVTELTTTSATEKDLNYHYRYSGSNPISQSDLDSALKNNIINSDCTTDETKKLLDLGAGLIYNYYDNNNNYIGKISVHLSDCK